MINLDNIFNKFFPKSKTAPMGKKLIVFAWIIEIIVACVGLSIAVLFFTAGSDNGSGPGTTDSIVVALAFGVVAIMELTKIPMATAFYYGAKIRWKLLFLLALLAVNFSTFETIIQGFELSYNQRIEPVNKIKYELKNIDRQIDKLKKEKLQDDDSLKKAEENRNRALESDTNLKDIIEKEKNSIMASNQSYQSADEDIKSKKNEINNLQSQIQQYSTNPNCRGAFGGDKCKNEKAALQNQIKNLNNEVSNLEKIKNDELRKSKSDVSKIDEKYKNQLEQSKRNLDTLQNIVANLSNSKDKRSVEAIDKDIRELQNKKVETEEKLNQIAEKTQIYRIALKIKTATKSDDIKDTDKSDGSNESKVNQNRLTAADLTQEDVDKAFWLWFGGLALVISIIGTLLAFAGLHLQDERMHELRNRPREAIGNYFTSLRRNLVLKNKLMWTSIKTKLKPIIKEVPVGEKIVEKIVEVEKPVIEEKIVIQKVEVPKEIIKKEIVHVPLWTNDPELINTTIDDDPVRETLMRKKKTKSSKKT